MQFGVFDHVDRGPFPLSDVYANRLRAIERYDALGFYGYHVAEHHGTALGMAPSPGIFLAAASQRTERLRLASMVYVLPLHDPLRLIEEICMLDNLSNGRLEIGFGRGSSPYELAFFDVPLNRSRGMYEEACTVVLSGLQSNALTFSGTYFHYEGVPMVLQPLQRPHPPLWHGLVRTNGVAWPAARGMNVVVNGPRASVRPLTDAYRAEWASRFGAEAALPKMALSRHIVVADTDEAALDLARSAYTSWYMSNDSLWRANGSRSASFPATYEDALHLKTLIAGSPDTVREAVANAVDECGTNYVMGRFAFGDIPVENVLRSIDLFGTEVMPAFAAGALTAAVSA